MRLFLIEFIWFFGVIYGANGQIEEVDLKRLTESVFEVGLKSLLQREKLFKRIQKLNEWKSID